MFCHYSKKRTLSFWIFPFLIKLASLAKISFIVGSYCALFSATSIITPLTGAFSGITGTCIVFALGLAAKIVEGSPLLSFKFLAYIVPGFCASLYWSTSSVVVRALLPLACMMAFIVHPAIGVGWVYSLYWLIPIALYFVKKQTLFVQALGSTFAAHAVGSVIWLYAQPMTPQTWLALMPVVLIERLAFASGMVIAYHVISYAHKLYATSFLWKKMSLLHNN